MTEKKACHWYVSGKVQGVWFRAETKKQAQQLALTGWVRNLDDGRVEVFACGHEQALAMLNQWLQVGPPLAEVKELLSEEVACEEHNTFEIR